MSEQLKSLSCLRCGAGFLLTDTYLDMLKRKGVKVVDPPQCPTCFVNHGPLPKRQGHFKWFSPRKHYGFIVTTDGEEVFLHERQFVASGTKPPAKGQPALFHVHYPFKGPEALNVEVLHE